MRHSAPDLNNAIDLDWLQLLMALMLCSSKLAYLGRFVSPHYHSRDLRLSAIHVSPRNQHAAFLARIVEAFMSRHFQRNVQGLPFDRFRDVFRAFSCDLLP